VIPDSVTTMGNHAFYNRNTIKILPNMSSLVRYFFRGCSSLISVISPSRITTLHSGTFEDCSSLISVHFPTNLIVISLLTFKGYSKLTTINAPSFSATTLGDSPEKLKHGLAKAEFYHIHLDTIVYGGDSNSDSTRSDGY